MRIKVIISAEYDIPDDTNIKNFAVYGDAIEINYNMVTIKNGPDNYEVMSVEEVFDCWLCIRCNQATTLIEGADGAPAVVHCNTCHHEETEAFMIKKFGTE